MASLTPTEWPGRGIMVTVDGATATAAIIV